MTLAVCFVRQLPDRMNRRELVFASDSRLSGGQRFDAGQKIFELPRPDSLFAFAGDCSYAFPWMLQMRAAISVYSRSSDTRFPLSDAKGHLIRVFNDLYKQLHGFPVGQYHPCDAEPPVQFLLGGYSWHLKEFRVWKIELTQDRRFVAQKCGSFCFIGDREAVKEARARTMLLLKERRRSRFAIDLEPVEVLSAIITEAKHSGVGGTIQIAKVYEYLRSQFFSTLLTDSSSRGTSEYVFGRKLLQYEQCGWPKFDSGKCSFVPRYKREPEPGEE